MRQAGSGAGGRWEPRPPRLCAAGRDRALQQESGQGDSGESVKAAVLGTECLQPGQDGGKRPTMGLSSTAGCLAPQCGHPKFLILWAAVGGGSAPPPRPLTLLLSKVPQVLAVRAVTGCLRQAAQEQRFVSVHGFSTGSLAPLLWPREGSIRHHGGQAAHWVVPP